MGLGSEAKMGRIAVYRRKLPGLSDLDGHVKIVSSDHLCQGLSKGNV